MKNEINVSNSTKDLTIIGITLAILIIMAYTPLGMIPMTPVSWSIAHAPIIIIAIVKGPVIGLIVGALFGVMTLIKAVTMPAGPLDLLFLNPLVSILPRALIGLGAYYAYKLFSKLNSVFAIAFGAAVGSLINTVGCLGMIYLLYFNEVVKSAIAVPDSPFASVEALMWFIFTTGGLPEMIVCTVISVIVIKALKKVFRV